jgi:hypothetical protein
MAVHSGFSQTKTHHKLSKIPSCDRCRYYAHSPYLICAIHPFGVTKSCRDFETAELWQPESLRDYLGLGMEEYDWHPIFTGSCPDCDRPFSRTQLPPLKWQCIKCGWEDEIC